MNKEHEKFTVSQWGALIRDKKCLIIRAPGNNYWELPGGRIEVEELDSSTAAEAFRREIKEELGLDDFEIMRPLGSMIGYTLKNHTPTCRIIYAIKNDAGEITLSAEHEESYWVSLEELENFIYSPLKNSVELKDIIKNALAEN